MTHLRPSRLVASLLFLASAALAADAGDPSAKPGLTNPLAAWSLDHLSVTRERPLFAPTRRPPPPPPPAPVALRVPAPLAPPPNVVLLGIVTADDGARAMVRTEGSSQVTRARLGDEIGGWKVTQIDARHLTLSSDDRSVSFALFARMNAKSATGRLPTGIPTEQQIQNVAQERIDRRSGR
jgi:hypothetical protein